jgi:hypothetical protein
MVVSFIHALLCERADTKWWRFYHLPDDNRASKGSHKKEEEKKDSDTQNKRVHSPENTAIEFHFMLELFADALIYLPLFLSLSTTLSIPFRPVRMG